MTEFRRGRRASAQSYGYAPADTTADMKTGANAVAEQQQMKGLVYGMPFDFGKWIGEACAPAQAAGGEPAGLAGQRLHRHRGRRAQPAHRLPRRPVRGVLLPDARQRIARPLDRRAARARGAEGGRDLPAAAACAAFAAAAGARTACAWSSSGSARRAWSTASNGTATSRAAAAAWSTGSRCNCRAS